MDTLLFPFAEYAWLYAAFTAGILALLSLDLGVFHRRAHEVGFREAATWSVIWVALALAFNVVLYLYAGRAFGESERLRAVPGFDPDAAAARVALEFLTGYIVEKSLALDNIFVFVVVFGFFSIPARYQHRVLFYGILGALIFRAIFIAAGAMLMQYHWVVVLFGLFLVATGVKLALAPEKAPDPERNPVIRAFMRVVPVTDRLHGDRFVVWADGRRQATPLLVALLFLEMTDVIFAVDSVPAIFALTREPFIVFTSNIFAILGLRSMYFLLAGAVERFHLLKYGLAAVLVFVGLKMVWLNEAFGGKFPIGWSLALIALALGSSIAASLWWPGDPRPTGARSPSGRGRDEHEVQLLGPVHPARERELDVGRPAGPRDESEVGRIADSGAAFGEEGRHRRKDVARIDDGDVDGRKEPSEA
ncbi:MAG: TerC family protein [Vicinamibacterales bacterium]